MSEPLPLSLLTDLSAALASLVVKVTACVVSVNFHRSRSSGFLWQPGLIVTADEALSEEGEFAVTLSGGETVGAQLVGRDPTTDVALLRIDRPNLPSVPLVASPVTAGALAMAVGAENGAPIAALGVVSRPRHVVDTRRRGLPQTKEARPQGVNADVIQERRQLFLSVPGDGLSYAGLRL